VKAWLISQKLKWWRQTTRASTNIHTLSSWGTRAFRIWKKLKKVKATATIRREYLLQLKFLGGGLKTVFPLKNDNYSNYWPEF